MMSGKYVTLEEFSAFHQVDIHLVEAFIQFGLVEPLRQEGQPCIREEDIEPLEAMVRIHAELDVNLPGVEAIMHLRRRLVQLRAQVEELENRLRWYERRFGAEPAPFGLDDDH